MLLELDDGLVTRVGDFALHQLIEIPMPLPDSHRVLVKEMASKDLSRIALPCVLLLILPKTILASERWDATCCTDTSAGHEADALFAN